MGPHRRRFPYRHLRYSVVREIVVINNRVARKRAGFGRNIIITDNTDWTTAQIVPSVPVGPLTVCRLVGAHLDLVLIRDGRDESSAFYPQSGRWAE